MEGVRQLAYIKLKEAAAEKYKGNYKGHIDVVDITVAFVKDRDSSEGGGIEYAADGKVILMGGGNAASAKASSSASTER